jgi:hypothetical protein
VTTRSDHKRRLWSAWRRTPWISVEREGCHRRLL